MGLLDNDINNGRHLNKEEYGQIKETIDRSFRKSEETKGVSVKELRIGNYLEFNYDQDDKVGWGLIEVDIKNIGLINDDDWRYAPITEEWLLNLGFKKPKGKDFFVQEGDLDSEYACIRVCDIYKIGIYTVSIGDDEVGVLFRRFRYIHELQNLFYSVDNKELTFGPHSKGGESVKQ